MHSVTLPTLNAIPQPQLNLLHLLKRYLFLDLNNKLKPNNNRLITEFLKLFFTFILIYFPLNYSEILGLYLGFIGISILVIMNELIGIRKIKGKISKIESNVISLGISTILIIIILENSLKGFKRFVIMYRKID